MKQTVILNEEDFVHARAGNRPEDYRPEIAEASRCDADECIQAVFRLAKKNGIDDVSTLSMDRLLQLTRAYMFSRYEEKLRISLS